MSDLDFLNELGAELERVARALPDDDGPLAWLRRLRLTTGLALGTLAALLTAGVATAAVLLIKQGRPLSAPPAKELGANSEPLPGSVHLAGLDAPDPAGGPAWDIRLSRTRTGETCTAVGQIVNHQFGIVGLDGVFRRLELGSVDVCGNPDAAGGELAGARVFLGRTQAQARTVVDGVAGADASSVTVHGTGAPRTLELGPDGSFITVYRGYVEDIRPWMTVTDKDGRTRTIAPAQPYAAQVSDPSGGTPWDVIAGANLYSIRGSALDQCVHMKRSTSPPEPGGARGPRAPAPFLLGTSSTPEYCGNLAQHPWFAAIQRIDPGQQQNGHWYWFQQPARTVVFGAASPSVQSVTATVSGAGTRQLPIDRNNGSFALVLDGHVDPAQITLTAKLADGSTRTSTGSATNLLNEDGTASVHGIASPPYRAAKPTAARRVRLPPADDFQRPLPSTISTTIKAKDPAGGREWTLRSWQATPSKGLRFGNGAASPRRFACEEAGVYEHGRLVQPAGNGPGTILSLRSTGFGGCNSTAMPRPEVSSLAYVRGAGSYDPQPVRVVVTGLVPLGSTDVTLLNAGAPRTITPDANGAFLAILPGSYWAADFRIRATLPNGQVRTSIDRRTGAAKPVAVAPDPDGGPPWGFTVGPHNWQMSAQVVDGRLATVAANGIVTTGGGFGGGGALQPGPLHVINPNQGLMLGKSTLTSAEIQRRTLPGRTVIEGTADADVRSVTIRTPRDVRTLIPAGAHHAFIAVYDGYFYDSVVTLTTTLADGKRVTEQDPRADYIDAGPIADGETPQQRLADLQRQLHLADTHRIYLGAARERASTLRYWRRAIAGIESRLAYARAHPGVLPPH